MVNIFGNQAVRGRKGDRGPSGLRGRPGQKGDAGSIEYSYADGEYRIEKSRTI